jgi:GR25 family glycosyltransferase involved in LPS biosynthesis
MRLRDVIPYMVCVNLAAREDRRREAWGRFAAAGLAVERQPGILKWTVTDPRGFKSAARYACSIAKRLAIRRAKLAGAPAVLLFEDDVVLAPDLHERLAEIELPADWGIFFLGCKHLKRPAVVAPGLVRVSKAADHHAIAIRREYYDAMIWGLAGGGRGSPRVIDYSDVKSSDVQRVIPTYACFPNLAWQAWSHSDNSGHSLTHYGPTGRQKSITSAVAGLEAEMAALSGSPAIPPPASLLPEAAILPAEDEDPPEEAWSDGESELEAVDTGEVGPGTNSRELGYGFLDGAERRLVLEETFPMRVYINLGRREDRRHEIEYTFALQGLDVERFAAVDARWVRRTRGHDGKPQYGCALSHRLVIRQARQLGAPAVLVFEDDAVLHPEFRRIAEAHAPPPDWGVLFYGCMHVKDPLVIAPGWVRVTSAYSMHAYAIRAEWYERVLAAMRKPDPGGRMPGCDVALTRLSGEIPMYACYPNLAWQAAGFSDLKKMVRSPYGNDGRQLINPRLVKRLEGGMRRQLAALRATAVEEEVR